jgi:hypothetical protein
LQIKGDLSRTFRANSPLSAVEAQLCAPLEREFMNKTRRLWACAAALSGLASCGDGTAGGDAAQAGGGVTVELPEPTERPANGTTAEVAAEVDEAAVPDSTNAAQATKNEVQAARSGAKTEEPVREPRPTADADVDVATAPAAEEAAEADEPAASGSLPLPNGVIVRTIEKIGFPCGSIASSSKVEGTSASSDYIIRCSSGASYRASNRSGRYRFSKAG